MVGTFYANLHELPDAQPHLDTMAWWKTQPEAWKKARENLQQPKEVMDQFKTWLLQPNWKRYAKSLVGYPIAYDYMWLGWYMNVFCQHGVPFNFSGIDIKTLNMLVQGHGYINVNRDTVKQQIDAKITTPHSHVAVEDAIGQGELFFQVIEYLKRQ